MAGMNKRSHKGSGENYDRCEQQNGFSSIIGQDDHNHVYCLVWLVYSRPREAVDLPTQRRFDI